MEAQSNEVLYSKEIIENMFKFYHSYEEYIAEMMKLENKKPDYIINPSKTIREKLDFYITIIKEKYELLKNSEQFQKNYSTYYNEKEDLLNWTFGEKGIEKLLPIAIFIFIKKCKLEEKNNKYYGFSSPFSLICNNFSLEFILQLLNSNEGNSIMIWKTIALVLIFINPYRQNFSNEENDAISFNQTKPLIKLSKGILLESNDNEKVKILCFNTRFVKPFLKSPTLLEAYAKVLSEKEELLLKDRALLKNRIEKEIDEFLAKDSIYFIYLFPEYGLTLADGSVLIRAPNHKNIENGACCLMTIFHEITHVLFRKIINTNTFRRSFDDTQDSGSKVEQLLVGELAQCHKEGCFFILDINNYKLSLTQFNKDFHSIEEKYNKADSNENHLITYNIYKKGNQRHSCIMTY